MEVRDKDIKRRILKSWNRLDQLHKPVAYDYSSKIQFEDCDSRWLIVHSINFHNKLEELLRIEKDESFNCYRYYIIDFHFSRELAGIDNFMPDGIVEKKHFYFKNKEEVISFLEKKYKLLFENFIEPYKINCPFYFT